MLLAISGSFNFRNPMLYSSHEFLLDGLWNLPRTDSFKTRYWCNSQTLTLNTCRHVTYSVNSELFIRYFSLSTIWNNGRNSSVKLCVALKTKYTSESGTEFGTQSSEIKRTLSISVFCLVNTHIWSMYQITETVLFQEKKMHSCFFQII